jgi:hypothetical protein
MMNDVDKIETPRGCIIKTSSSSAEITWNPGFSQKWEKSFGKAQEFVDSEVLRLCTPKIPLQTSMLIKSGQLGTYFGRGYVEWIANYAKEQYYTATTRSYDPNRGGQWFARMKAESGPQIIAGAKKIISEESKK